MALHITNLSRLVIMIWGLAMILIIGVLILVLPKQVNADTQNSEMRWQSVGKKYFLTFSFIPRLCETRIAME